MDKEQLFIKIATQAWDTQITRINRWLYGVTEEQLMEEIASGKNRGIYIVGHLLAIHDAMNKILGVGPRAHAALDEAFVKNPDKSAFDMPAVDTLKRYWNEVHENLSNHFKEMQPGDWFKRHHLMTDEDFAKEPARNKLSVLINRTNHAAYHLGQLRLFK